MSVVIPAGTAALPVLLAALPAVDEVIVVVGRDGDTTTAPPRATRVIRQTRTGVGNALACGVAASIGDVVVTMPGDGGCEPAELPRYVRALLDGADVAQGSRFRGNGRDLAGGRTSRLGARIVLWLMAVLFGVRRSDPGFGFRAFWRDAAGSAGFPRVSGIETVRGDGVEIEPLLTVRAAANGLFVTEVPATAHPRTAPSAQAGLVEAVRALLGEYVARRRSARRPEASSIVVMTGRDSAPESLTRTGTDAGPISPGARTRAAMTARAGSEALSAGVPLHPGFGGTNREPGARRRDLPPAPGASTVPLGGERRLGARRHAGPVDGRTLGEATTVRRQWRDNQGQDVGDGRRRVQGRPNLRVINGEGAGDGSSRTGKLRAVPPGNPDR
ncbi:glycosyltransferase family 2 protein [Actinoplanes sp. NPDC020271]|uniref:glycosyltransferase family 2 protein n=1 Tax=Actinoplanes sp. NPDC020271 TaxID=3363896 RepID=UPI0037A39697